MTSTQQFLAAPDESGFYGEFGGAFIPELLYPNVEELRNNYLRVIRSASFQKEFRRLLNSYAGRPTALTFAPHLSRLYHAEIYLKREDLVHTGAHKINNAIGQILLARELGKSRIIAETGAGQHGVAVATVCARMGLPCVIYMGETDIERQALNVARMKMLGAEVVAVYSGNKTLKDATNEAIRDWISHPDDTHYIIGSVVGPHPYPDLVTRLQSVISEELKSQLTEITGRDYPDYIIACVGGGSNAAGIFYHYLQNENVQLIGVEAAGLGIKTSHNAATLFNGSPGILHGCFSMLIQNEDGQITEPYSISAGLDYPGVGPGHAFWKKIQRVKYESATDEEALQAGLQLARYEGIIPALESAHALASLKKIHFKKEDVVVINLSGRGDKDMNTYSKMLKL